MAPRNLKLRTSLLGLFPHVTYTLEKLRAEPLGAAHVPTFEALYNEGLQVLTSELGIIGAQMGAQVRVDSTADKLNEFAGRVSKAVLIITHDERDNPLYTHFFGNKNLSEFRRPKLGDKLESMRKWIPSLQQSPFPALQAMAAELVTLVAEADAADAARDSAQQQNRFFRDVGARRQWVDSLNAARKGLYGALAQLAHQHPELPSNYAELFFLREKGDDDAAEEPEETVETLQARAEELSEELGEIQERIAALEEAEVAAKEAAAARAAQEAQLAELDRAAAELEKQRAALQKRLAADALA